MTGWTVAAFALLGVYHGVNPGMGWLLAVGRGLQDRSRRSLLLSLLPIAVGHELSVVLVVGGVLLTQAFVPPHTIRLLAALVLISFGVYKIWRPRAHPRGSGMRMGLLGLAGWSFLMASAHGAGLMLAPVLLGMPVSDSYADVRGIGLVAAMLSAVHVTVMLGTMAVVAVIVYERLGLNVLRRAWVNLDLGWAAILVASGVVALLLP